MQKYAVCFIYYSIGEATEYSQIVWLTNDSLAWAVELENAMLWDDRATAEVQMELARNLIHDKTQVFNVVTINWHECNE
jgi:hypothetical protein